MSNDLERWARPASLLSSREERAFEHDIAAAARSARAAALRLDAAAAISARRMERTSALDDQRRALGANNPTLDAVLGRIELGFVLATEGLEREVAGRGLQP